MLTGDNHVTATVIAPVAPQNFIRRISVRGCETRPWQRPYAYGYVSPHTIENRDRRSFEDRQEPIHRRPSTSIAPIARLNAQRRTSTASAASSRSTAMPASSSCARGATLCWLRAGPTRGGSSTMSTRPQARRSRPRHCAESPNFMRSRTASGAAPPRNASRFGV